MNVRNFLTVIMTAALAAPLCATDPCGMVPPIYTGVGSPITRIGLQKTYVFHRNGMESFVIKPGFQGKIDNFGMLIPFPNPPAIRKVADDTFDHIVNTVDPPEVVQYVQTFRGMAFGGGAMGGSGEELDFQNGLWHTQELETNEVKVLKEEAVGMYEVATLAAGSSESLKRWMDDNGFQYPEGMDEVCEEYIEQEWCFVAVKTKVNNAAGAQPLSLIHI